MTKRYGGEGSILIFQVSEGTFNRYKGKVFKGDSKEWRQFVYNNRNGLSVTNYDFIEGPMLRNPQDKNDMSKYKTTGHQIAIRNAMLAADIFKGFIGTYTMGAK